MLDLKLIRQNPDQVAAALAKRSGDYSQSLSELQTLDSEQRGLEGVRSQLQARSNEIGKSVGMKIKGGADPKGDEVKDLRTEGNQVKKELSELEPKEKELKAKIHDILLTLPNLPNDSTPEGKDEEDNVEVRRWGDDLIPQGDGFLAHYELGEKLGIMNFERSVKIAQSRFVTLIGAGAALERALIQFMLDRHTKVGYTEILPPILVNSASLTGSGQLPKFAEDSFKCADDDLWLTPTAEVPLTNLHRSEILTAEELPINYCAYTPCFRREAGSYGRDTRGLIRLHQFNKVEMFKFVHPETSFDELETLTKDAEDILQQLKLPYRVLALCTGDMGFSATKTYDLEVWLPSANRYREISSCSNCVDFQARRADIRFKVPGQKGTQFVHTLNGSGLAIGRTMAAILENYQQPNGSVKVPNVLQPYLGREFL
ncbi:serine--tRNA ligase [Leptothoe spongobia]|uniref:Serine--tRNA ligase n=1 Tax=Leptothoe spongobia TAU-MAC 1115 TaxID=1967444 RepID=A0A947DF71_9CYAN|nr:serine--tRNA ligase [Leptothoe spongobia]MBT9314796.1 serine--tRNA ligase [Leptothoe spongobia TAU-MAC 1115]